MTHDTANHHDALSTMIHRSTKNGTKTNIGNSEGRKEGTPQTAEFGSQRAIGVVTVAST